MNAPKPPAAPNLPPYATHVEGRKPKFKTHTTLAHAHGAVVTHHPPNDVYVYELGPDGWKVIEEFIVPDKCTSCNQPWVPDRWNRREQKRSWGDRHLKEWQKPLICRTCYRKTVDEFNAAATREREMRMLASLKQKYPEGE